MTNAPFSPSPAHAATCGIPADERIGLGSGAAHFLEPELRRYINPKLAALGFPQVNTSEESELEGMTRLLLARQQQTYRLLADYLCPADQRIQTFLHDYLQEDPVAKLPGRTFVLDRHGLARVLSLPAGSDHFSSGIIDSYRVKSDWYRERLEAKCKIDRLLAQRHIRALKSFLSKPTYSEEAARLGIAGRLTRAYRHRDATESEVYLQKLQGTLGVHPFTC